MTKAWPVDDLDPDASVLVNARRVLAVRIGELYSYAPIIGRVEEVEALHNMRIAAKRLRYTLELFRPEFGAAGDRQIGHIKEIQEALGTLHDYDVRIDLIRDELARLALEQSASVGEALAEAPEHEFAAIAAAALRPPPDDPRRGLIGLLGRQHAVRRETHDTFVALWKELNAAGMRGELVTLSTTPVSECQPLTGEAA